MIKGLVAGSGIIATHAAAPGGADDAGSPEADVVGRAAPDRFAVKAANDAAAVERILGEDLVYRHSTAQVESKGEFLESMRRSTVKYLSLEPRDQAVVRVWPDGRHHRGNHHHERGPR